MAAFTVNRDINAVIGPFTIDVRAGVTQFCPDDLFDEVEQILEGTPGVVVTFLAWDREGGIGGNESAVTFVIDGLGGEITDGIKGDFELPFTGSFVGWRLLADQTGSLVVDLWKTPYSGFPPNASHTITALGTKPTLTAASKATDDALTGWQTSFTEGDIVRLNVDSCTTITRATLSLILSRE